MELKTVDDGHSVTIEFGGRSNLYEFGTGTGKVPVGTNAEATVHNLLNLLTADGAKKEMPVARASYMRKAQTKLRVVYLERGAGGNGI